jgi:cell shape-determining protein MreD
MFFFCIAALVLAVLLEGTVTTIPLVVVVLLCLTVMKRGGIVFLLAFFSGILLDIMTLHTLGQSSLFFTVMIFLVFLYQRKYEIHSYPFIVFSSFFGSLFFLLFFGYGSWFVQSLISAVIAVILFAITKRFAR